MAIRSVPKEDRYVLTERGRLDIECAHPCSCNPRMVGLLIECPECGTVYGSVRDSMNWGQGHAEYKRP